MDVLTREDLHSDQYSQLWESTVNTVQPTEKKKRFTLRPDIQPFVFNNIPEPGTFEAELWAQTENMPDPEQERARLDVAMAFSNALDLEFETAYNNVDALIDVMATGKGAGREAVKMKGTEARDYLSRMHEIGQKITERGHLGFDMVENGVSEQKLEKLKALDEEIGKLYENETKNPFLWAVGQAAQMWPTMFQGVKKGAQKAIVLGPAFAGVAAAASGPLAPISAPVAGAMGMSVGMAWGTAQETFNVEGGNFFGDMVTDGVDPNIAQWGALGAGFLSALVETIQVSQILSQVPGMDKVFRSGIGKAIKTATGKVTKSTAGRIALQYGLNVATETGEEVLQEIVSIAAEDIVKQTNDAVHGTQYESAWKGAGEQILEVAKSSVAGLSVMGLPGLAGNVMKIRPNIRETQSRETTERVYQDVEDTITPRQREEITSSLGMDVYEEIRTLEEQKANLETEYADNPQEYTVQLIQKQREIDFLKDQKFQEEIKRNPPAWMKTEAEWNADIEQRIADRGEIIFSDQFKQKIADNVPQLSEQEIESVAVLTDLFSEYVGVTRDQFLTQAFGPQIFADREAAGQVLTQGKRGATQILEDGKALIHASKQTDFSTMVHEMGHVFRRWLRPEEQQIFETWLGIEDGKWTTEHEETFAKHLERYLQQGYAPNDELRSAFQQIADFIRKVFAYIGERWNLTPEAIEGYNRIFTPREGRQQAPQAGEAETLFQPAPPTDSEAFRKWFGDSKVVDENGNPLVVYHGTPRAGFYVFDKSKIGTATDSGAYSAGFYFTSAKSTADAYANREKKGGRIYECYLSIQNPFIYKDNKEKIPPELIAAINKEQKKDTGNRYRPDLSGVSKDSIYYMMASIEEENKDRTTELKIGDKFDDLIYYLNGLSRGGSELLTTALESLGYDGVFAKEGNRREYVAFSPEQIKSVYNKGTFDAENPNILYQKAPPAPKLTPRQISDIAQYAEYGLGAGKEDLLTEVKKILKGANAKHLDAYHVAKKRDVENIKKYGLKSSEWYGKAPGVYFFADPDDINAESYKYLNVKMDDSFSEGETLSVIHFKIPTESLQNIKWDGLFNVDFGTYSSFVHFGDIKPEQILSTHDAYFSSWPEINAGQSAILYKDYAHMEEVRQAVEAGLPVPEKVLQEYNDQEWARNEIMNRSHYSEEATTFQNVEEYVSYAMAMDPEGKPRSYWEAIYNQAKWRAENDPVSRKAGNDRFIKSLTKPALVMYLMEAAKQQALAGFHGIIQSGAKAAIKSGNITDAHYKKIMDQIRANPAFYREEFALLVEDRDELELLNRERESDPTAAEIEDLQLKLQQARQEAKAAKEKLSGYQDRIDGLDSRLRWAERDLEKKQQELKDFESETKEAQKDATKSARQEARLQKELAVKEAKEQLRETQRKRKEAKEMTEYFHKLVRQIMKPASAAIKWDHAKQIREIQDGLALKGPRSQEYQNRQKLQQFLKEDPDADWKPEVIAEANKTSVYDLTIQELEELYDRVDNLRERGRFERDMDILDEEKWNEQQRYAIFQTVTGGFPPEDTNVGSETYEKKRKTKPVKKAAFQFIRPDRMAEWLDGGKPGPFKRLLRDYINDAYDSELVELNRRLDIAQDKMKSLDISLKELARIIEVDGAPYTVDKAIHMWIAMQDPDSAATLVNGNKIDPETINSFIEKLDPKFIEWGKFMMDEFSGENFERINAVVRAVDNKEMVKVDRYFPIRREGTVYNSTKEELASEILDRHAVRRASPQSKFKIERTHSEGASFIPMRLGATNLFFDQLQKQEKYIAAAKLAKQLNRIFNDEDVTRAIRQKWGDEANTWLQKYINDWVNPNIYKTNDTLHHVSRVLRSHAALSYLAFNLVTPLKQIPSLAFYLADAGPFQLMKAAVEMIVNRQETTRFIDENDPQVKYRSFDRITEELKLQGKGAYDRFVQKVGKAGMAMIQFMDRQAILIGWRAVYNKAINDGLSHDEAVRKAKDVTLRTQPQAAAKDLPQAYRTNEILNWFLMFSNQLNQIYNMITRDVPTDLKNKKWGHAMGTMSAVVISGLMIGALSKRRLPDEPEEFAEDILDQLISAIPVVGGNIKSGMTGYWGTGVDPIPVASEVGSMIKAVDGAVKGNAELELKTVLRLLEAAMVTAGMPTVQPRRVINTIVDENPWELIGGQWGEE